jgi:hypothetical protein
MPRPVCVPCRTFYRCKENGYTWTETIYEAGGHVPYKLWMSDLWQCPKCEHLMVTGHGNKPVRERHEPDFDELIDEFEPKLHLDH